ncbi:MAG: helix-turn-helix domain-containing protein [Candidatus Dormibacteraceae bacterium]
MSQHSYHQSAMRLTKSTSFDEFYDELEAEAQAQGAEAIRDLLAKEVKYALINALITRRRDLNLTQENLAERSGVAQTEISRIERGRKSPTMDTFSRLASALRLEFWPTSIRRARLSLGASASRGGRTVAGRQAAKPAAGRARATSRSVPVASKRSDGLGEVTREPKRRLRPSPSTSQKPAKRVRPAP